MRILVVNDDGIDAKGIEILAREAARFGDVWVAAPDEQCSAMSHGITLRRDISVKESPFPLRASLAENFLAPRPVEEPPTTTIRVLASPSSAEVALLSMV